MKTAQNLLTIKSLWRIFTVSVIFAFSFLLFAFVSPTHANDEAEPSAPKTFSSSYNSNSDVPANFHSVVQIVVVETLSAVNCQLSGQDSLSPNHKCLGFDPDTGKVGFVEGGGGAIGFMGNMIDSTLTPPASGVQYLVYLQNNFGIAKNAHAAPPIESECLGNTQGVGFCSLLPLLPIWEAMRNIVYLLLILIFVIIGMGIMLRLHIDPRTVMTIQNQIPKIIVGILAITFSFAIAGFLIDIMWVTIYLFASVLASTGDFINSENLIAVTQAADPFDAVNKAYQDWGILSMSYQVGTAFSSLIVDMIIPVLGDILSNILGVLITGLGTIIIFIAILIVLIRLWISLILAYVYVILDVIFAPFFILAGLIPGSSLGLGSWLRDIIANLAVFPMTIAFILLGSYLMKAVSFDSPTNGPVLSPPLLGGTRPEAIAVLIGFGFLLILPNMLSTMKAALKAPKMSFGSMLGPINSASGAPKRMVTGAQQYAGQPSYIMGDKGMKEVSRRTKLARSFGVIK